MMGLFTGKACIRERGGGAYSWTFAAGRMTENLLQIHMELTGLTPTPDVIIMIL